jgi:hypothetical protein
MARSLKVSGCLVALVILGFVSIGSAELVDDFGGPQNGSWAPARWWTDYARRERLTIPSDTAPKLDIGFSKARREKEIIAAGGFVVEVDVLEIRGLAAICIGASEYEERAIAVVLQADGKDEKDKLYVNGKVVEIETDYQIGQRVRIEVDTEDFDESGDISVRFGSVEVVSEYPFEWKKSPVGFFLAAKGGRAIYDNLVMDVAGPTIAFAESASAATEQKESVSIDLVLEHAGGGRTYSVGCEVSSKTAERDADYVLDSGTVTFRPGQTRKTINLKVKTDGVEETDEVVELMLHGPKGGGVELGGRRSYRHTIIGELPLVQFESPTVVLAEDSGDTHVNVALSHPCERQVIVGYALVSGTAKTGRDLRVPAGRLVFEPGQRSQSITVDLIDDLDAENSINETAFVQLQPTKDCGLGDNSKLRIEIADNEPWIEFDGSMWICGFNKHTKIKGQKVLSINRKGHLEWVCTYGDILYAKLPAQSVSNVGEVAEYGWLYKGEGQGKGSYVENICERYGSGDLRLAMLDLRDKSMSLEKQYTRNDQMFCGSRGYQARLSPHVPTDQRADKWATRVTPNGGNCHSPVDWGGCWGFETYYNGHGVPVGEFSPMIIAVERTTEDTIEFSVDMNNEKHIMVDKNKYLLSQDKEKMREHFGMGAYGTGAYGTGYGPGVYEVEIAEDYQPEKIDVMAIYFANQRPFDLITFAPLK